MLYSCLEVLFTFFLIPKGKFHGPHPLAGLGYLCFPEIRPHYDSLIFMTDDAFNGPNRKAGIRYIDLGNKDDRSESSSNDYSEDYYVLETVGMVIERLKLDVPFE